MLSSRMLTVVAALTLAAPPSGPRNQGGQRRFAADPAAREAREPEELLRAKIREHEEGAEQDLQRWPGPSREREAADPRPQELGPPEVWHEPPGR